MTKIAHKKRKKTSQNSNANILPNYVLNRRIKIITNGKIVFDSLDYKDGQIPTSIQYTIKQYGYPKTIKPDNNTPLIYNISLKSSSLPTK